MLPLASSNPAEALVIRTTTPAFLPSLAMAQEQARRRHFHRVSRQWRMHYFLHSETLSHDCHARERLPSHDGFIIVGIGFEVEEEEGGGTLKTEVVMESGAV
jgi:hypothetical protein